MLILNKSYKQQFIKKYHVICDFKNVSNRDNINGARGPIGCPGQIGAIGNNIIYCIPKYEIIEGFKNIYKRKIKKQIDKKCVFFRCKFNLLLPKKCRSKCMKIENCKICKEIYFKLSTKIIKNFNYLIFDLNKIVLSYF